MLAWLDGTAQRALVQALGTAQRLLDPDREAAPITLRTHRAGDIGWIVHRQAAIYAEEFGWDISFEAVLAEIGAAFIRNYDPQWEACWLAERDGAILGSVTLVRQSADVAKLRMLYVEPAARGLGVGRLLVGTCIERARASGYSRMTLWTNDPLVAARKIYAAFGFRLTAAEPPAMAFGQMMASETWDLDLAAAPANATATTATLARP
jgi:GNAT superfamily N-acetyltransferase